MLTKEKLQHFWLKYKNTSMAQDLAILITEFYRLRQYQESLERHFEHCDSDKLMTLQLQLECVKSELGEIKKQSESLDFRHLEICKGFNEQERQLEEAYKKIAELNQELANMKRWKPYLHSCREWDGLVIDKGDVEFANCHCFDPDEDV